jgi:hypothetical protein
MKTIGLVNRFHVFDNWLKKSPHSINWYRKMVQPVTSSSTETSVSPKPLLLEFGKN